MRGCKNQRLDASGIGSGVVRSVQRERERGGADRHDCNVGTEGEVEVEAVPIRCRDQHAVAGVTNRVEKLVVAGTGAGSQDDVRGLRLNCGPEVCIEGGEGREETRVATETLRVREVFSYEHIHRTGPASVSDSDATRKQTLHYCFST